MGKREHADEAAKIAENIAASVKRLRAERGYSLDEVAARSGLTKSHVWEIEHGRSFNPTITTCIGLARALGVSIEFLIGITTKEAILHPDALRIACDIDHLLRKRKRV